MELSTMEKQNEKGSESLLRPIINNNNNNNNTTIYMAP